MWSKLLLIVSVLYMTAQISAQDLDHYYIKISGKDRNATSYEYSYGTVTHHATKLKCKLQDEVYESPSDFIESIRSKNQSNEIDVNIYIHGMWANNGIVWKETASYLGRYIMADMPRKQVVISIIWDAAILYPNSVELARKKGKQASELMPIIWSVFSDVKSKNIIAHSMGNRVWEEMIKPYLDVESKIKIGQYLSIGADLEDTIFDKDQPLELLPHLCDSITIYMHNNDRTLKISKMLNDNDRLGLAGVPTETLNHKNIKLVDVTLLSDNRGIGGKFSNHRYYYTSPLAMSDINATLCHRPQQNRVVLGPDNYLISDYVKDRLRNVNAL